MLDEIDRAAQHEPAADDNRIREAARIASFGYFKCSRGPTPARARCGARRLAILARAAGAIHCSWGPTFFTAPGPHPRRIWLKAVTRSPVGAQRLRLLSSANARDSSRRGWGPGRLNGRLAILARAAGAIKYSRGPAFFTARGPYPRRRWLAAVARACAGA